MYKIKAYNQTAVLADLEAATLNTDLKTQLSKELKVHPDRIDIAIGGYKNQELYQAKLADNLTLEIQNPNAHLGIPMSHQVTEDIVKEMEKYGNVLWYKIVQLDPDGNILHTIAEWKQDAKADMDYQAFKDVYDYELITEEVVKMLVLAVDKPGSYWINGSHKLIVSATPFYNSITLESHDTIDLDDQIASTILSKPLHMRLCLRHEPYKEIIRWEQQPGDEFPEDLKHNFKGLFTLPIEHFYRIAKAIKEPGIYPIELGGMYQIVASHTPFDSEEVYNTLQRMGDLSKQINETWLKLQELKNKMWSHES